MQLRAQAQTVPAFAASESDAGKTLVLGQFPDRNFKRLCCRIKSHFRGDSSRSGKGLGANSPIFSLVALDRATEIWYNSLMFRFPRLGLALAAALLAGSVPLRAQPFTNGGFEIVIGTPIASNTSRILNPGDTWLPGWSAGGPDGSVAVQNGFVGVEEGGELLGLGPWQGQQWAILTDDIPGGTLSQTFQTGVGDYCTVTFVSGYAYTADDPMLAVTIAASDRLRSVE